MTEEELKEAFSREQREFVGRDGGFALFVAWRQMKALEAVAENTAPVGDRPTLDPNYEHFSLPRVYASSRPNETTGVSLPAKPADVDAVKLRLVDGIEFNAVFRETMEKHAAAIFCDPLPQSPGC